MLKMVLKCVHKILRQTAITATKKILATTNYNDV